MIREILPYERIDGDTQRDAIDENGDVVLVEIEKRAPLTEGEENDLYDAEIAEQNDLERAIADIQNNGSFNRRNQVLLRLVDLAGLANQDWGAAQQEAIGNGNNIPGSNRAVERCLERENELRKMAELACRVCPLADYCDQESSRQLFIKSILKNQERGMPDRRVRTRRRVSGGSPGGEDLTKNVHFCRTVIEEKRLPRIKV